MCNNLIISPNNTEGNEVFKLARNMAEFTGVTREILRGQGSADSHVTEDISWNVTEEWNELGVEPPLPQRRFKTVELMLSWRRRVWPRPHSPDFSLSGRTCSSYPIWACRCDASALCTPLVELRNENNRILFFEQNTRRTLQLTPNLLVSPL